MSKVRFGDVASRLNIKVDQANTDLEYYIGGEHIESSEFMIHDRAPIKGSTIGYQFQFGFRKGDILFMTKNPHLRKTSMVDFDGLCSIATFVIHTNDESVLMQDYLLIEMQTDRFWDYCETHKSGGVNYFINWGTLANYEFELPPFEKQKELSEKLWAAYRLKESYRKLLKATDEMVKSRFIEMFGPETALLRKYPVKKLGDLADCYAGATPSTTVREYWDNGTISWMSSGEVHLVHVDQTEAKITQKGYDHASTKMVPIHSVVIALAGQGRTRGTVAITEIPLCTNQSLCAIVPGEELHYEYLFHNLNGRYLELRGMAGDVNGRGGLNLRIIQNIPIVVPPMDDQLAFVTIARQADKSKFELKQAIEKIDKVMRALLQ